MVQRIIDDLQKEFEIIARKDCEVRHLDEVIARCRSIINSLHGEHSYEAEVLAKTIFSDKVNNPFSGEYTIYESTLDGIKYVIGLIKGKNDSEILMSRNSNPSSVPLTIDNLTSFDNKSVFIVHGHDEAAKQLVARTLMQFQLNPIVLSEQNIGAKTIVEKIEHFCRVGFAIAIFTEDDEGPIRFDGNREMRARQNVLLETGYFHAALGRESLFILKKGNVAIPSDYDGLIYHELDNGGGWKISLSKELNNVGIKVDLNKISSR